MWFFFQMTMSSYNITCCFLPLTSSQACMVAPQLLLVSSWLVITYKSRTSLEAQWYRICLPMQETRVRSPPGRIPHALEHSACPGAARPRIPKLSSLCCGAPELRLLSAGTLEPMLCYLQHPPSSSLRAKQSRQQRVSEYAKPLQLPSLSHQSARVENREA